MSNSAYSRTTKFQLWMNDHEIDCLEVLAEQWKISKSEVIRRLVVNELIVQQRVQSIVNSSKN